MKPQEAAEAVGLQYVSDQQPGIKRVRRGRGFRYLMPNGEPVSDAKTLARIRKLAIPPAYCDVWISLRPNGHLQATGRDARGRKQYRYHDRFRELRESTKFEHILEFAKALPAIRAQVDRHMAMRGVPREKVLATIVYLLETTMIRVGNADYARQNKSYGLTTMRNRHLDITGSELRFRFQGKSGRQWNLRFKDRRVATIVKAIQELPGQPLFQYLGDDDALHEVTSGDINDYLREISGKDITAKDFRTWHGTVLAVRALLNYPPPQSAAEAKSNLRSAINVVAASLGNTPSICRRCYIHPEIPESYLEGSLGAQAVSHAAQSRKGTKSSKLGIDEALTFDILCSRLRVEGQRVN